MITWVAIGVAVGFVAGFWVGTFDERADWNAGKRRVEEAQREGAL